MPIPASWELPPDWEDVDYTPLLEKLGVELSRELLIRALCHRSYAYEHPGIPNNERLEFLGDSVLNISVTERLFQQYPDRDEGELAKMRANIVSGYSLARLARTLGPHGLGEYLLLGRGEELTGGRDKESILADATEAVFGAVHVTHGIEVSRKVVLGLMQPLIDQAGEAGIGLDWKTSLQEYAASEYSSAPSYYITSTGPDHAKVFFATGILGGRAYGTGTGTNKKRAEQAAARATWEAIQKGQKGEKVSEQVAQTLDGMPANDINLDIRSDMPKYALTTERNA
ncbi:MAG: ribonuclease III [Lawsonella sp.]